MMLSKIRPSIVLFGDSITQQGFSYNSSSPGWAGLLANAYTRRADVLNRGYSGYNTRHAIDILPSVFGPEGDSAVGRPLFITVFFGANDAQLPGEREYNQGVPIDEYEDNLRKIVEAISGRFQQDSKPPIILFTPPPVDKMAWELTCLEKSDEPVKSALLDRTNENSKLYGDRVKSVAKELGCSVVDSHTLLFGYAAEETYGKNLDDGLHLNGSGNKLLFDGVIDIIKRDFPHLAPMEDGDGKYGQTGVPVEAALWKELC